ncbi:TniQ family protein [Streptomyces violascens]|uniref:TniQ family protein n=1 Tax=Streptomyces violascens TaxID=67381 RepID=UPI00167C1EE8|nr:TniQ family protein [Streptomyces violascens]
MNDTAPQPAPITAAELPIRVPLITGETVASFVLRTATANGLPVPALLATLDEGLVLPDEDLVPQREEVTLSTAALARLAVLVDREPGQLARALPGLHPDRLLDAGAHITSWPRDRGAAPLPACPLCMEPGAWLAADGHRWRPCGCGRRWMSSDDGGYLIDTGPVPELGRALLHHRQLVHRVGHVADALVADAHQVMLWWWISGQFAADVWRAREDALGMERHRRRAAPAVVYPEALALAEAMWTWEERRRRRGVSAEAWIEDVERIAPAGIIPRRERAPLRYWLEQHRPEAAARPVGRTTPERRWNRLPALHRPPAEPGLLRAPSCLMWVFGLPLTATSAICPTCGGRAPTCRWVPYQGCTGSPGD